MKRKTPEDLNNEWKTEEAYKDIETCLKTAYLKYKSYVYYNNTDINNKIKIAEFEEKTENTNIGEKFNTLIDKIKSNDIDEYLEKITYYLLPKSFENIYSDSNCQIIYNKNICKEYELKKYNFFIDMPIELHIINVLWIMKIGYLLDEDYCDYFDKSLSCCYANRLVLDKNKEIVYGKNLFKPYVKQYNTWRDNCISKAEKMLDDNKDVIIFSFDIQSYYNSISFNFEEFSEQIEKKYSNVKPFRFLTNYIEKIRDKYIECIKQDFPDFIEDEIKFNDKLLPIGALSSNILANWYLYDFDKTLLKKVNPTYYGRYVDDILIVLENNNTCVNKCCQKTECEKSFKIKDLINKYYKKIFISKKNGFVLKNYENLIIQEEKIKIFSFDANSSRALLTKFKENIRKHSSEFRFLPEDDRIENDLVQEGYSIDYCDSINKLRSIEKYRLDKFKVSSFLAKQLSISKYIKDKKHFKKIFKELMYSFNGRLGLDLYIYWYKMLIYIILNDDLDAFLEFTKTISQNIKKIQYKKDCSTNNATTKKIKAKIISNLKTFFTNSLKLAIAYNPQFCIEKIASQTETDDKITYKINNEILNRITKENLFNNIKDVDTLILDIHRILFANIIKHSYCYLPIITYFDIDKKLINLFNSNILSDKDILDLDIWKKSTISEHKRTFNPQNVKYSDIQYFNIFKEIITKNYSDNIELNEEINTDGRPNDNHTEDDSSNKEGDSSDIKIDFTNIPDTFRKFNHIDSLNKDVDKIQYSKNIYKFSSKSINISNLIIGIFNLKISEKDILDNLENQNDLSFDYFSELMKFLNLSIEKNYCNIIIFPEISIPFQYLELLQDFSRRKNIAIIGGLRHLICPDKNVYNYIMTILPFKNDINSTDNMTILRNKVHFSPNEIGLLDEHQLKIVKNKEQTNNLFIWNDIYFACYDCFELADIKYRSQYKSEVDMIIACEWNKDTHYFDKIVESATRDLHCYVVQVNTSQFGHSKIIAPKSKDEMTILNITGGKDNILIGEINIKALRDFQKLKHIPEKKYPFKPLPPDFIKDKIPDRLKDKN